MLYITKKSQYYRFKNFTYNHIEKFFCSIIWLLYIKFLEICREYKNWKKILRSVKSWVVPNVLDGEPITPKNWHLHVAINYPSFLRTQAVNERYLKILINPIFIWTYLLLNSGYSWTYAIKVTKIFKREYSGRFRN